MVPWRRPARPIRLRVAPARTSRSPSRRLGWCGCVWRGATTPRPSPWSNNAPRTQPPRTPHGWWIGSPRPGSSTLGAATTRHSGCWRSCAFAEKSGITGGLIEILALQALVLWANNEKERAMSTLTQALALAEPEGFVRTIVDEGPAMAELLSAALEARQRGRLGSPVPVHYIRRLLVATEKDGAKAVQPATELPEPLSERELEVLVLIAAGKSNPEIARELFIVLSTVKTHLKNVYRKLGARNRTQAVSRARELNLL